MDTTNVTATQRIFRYEVPVDDRWHVVELRGGEVLHVATRERPDVVEFWALHDERQPSRKPSFLVIGTRQPVPPDATYQGTALAADGRLVWHLFERTPERPS